MRKIWPAGFCLMLLTGCGVSGVNGYREVLTGKVNSCMEYVINRQWERVSDMMESTRTREPLSRQDRIEAFKFQFDRTDHSIESYEIADIWEPTPSLSEPGVLQSQVQVKILGRFPGNRSDSGILMTFMQKDGNWFLYNMVEIPDMFEPL